MANIVRSWKKIMALGCTHGEYQHDDAIAAALLFADEWKPEIKVHLGDNWDTKALRSGSKGTADESAPLDGDLARGRQFIRDYRPTHFSFGNHDERPFHLAQHHNTIIRECAQSVCERMMEPLREVKAQIRRWNVWEAFEIGGYKWWHGTSYSINYLRDTANAFGNSVVAHAHRAGVQKGRRFDNPTAYGVGTLADIPAMDYAATRIATLDWSHGIVFGEVCEDKAQLHLHEWQRGETEWRLPCL